jgi:PTH1 family peptidyl-tRNA hydrolase
MNDPFLIVGLGNPGPKYKNNRHNIGFHVADALLGTPSVWVNDFKGEYNKNVNHFLKPMTFINNSGESIIEAKNFFKIYSDKVIVIHDDLDLPVGKVKVKMAGGHGGHNGIKNIDKLIGKDYWRVRVGIGHPGDRNLVLDYVLGDFTPEEWIIQEKTIKAIVECFPILLNGDEQTFMNKVALLTNGE